MFKVVKTILYHESKVDYHHFTQEIELILYVIFRPIHVYVVGILC